MLLEAIPLRAEFGVRIGLGAEEAPKLPFHRFPEVACPLSRSRERDAGGWCGGQEIPDGVPVRTRALQRLERSPHARWHVLEKVSRVDPLQQLAHTGTASVSLAVRSRSWR